MREPQEVQQARASGSPLRLLGPPSVRPPHSGTAPSVQPLASGKPLALLAYLACAPGRSATREQLIDLLWSDADAEAGRHTLRQTLWYIKRKLGTDPFATAGEVVRLAIPLPCDRDSFLAALDADDPESAVAAYGGDFFPGFAAPGGAAFEQWADLERTRLRTLFIGAAARVVRDRLAAGRAREALAVARRTQELAGRSQSSWRLVLECLMASGDLLGARVEVGRLRQWLADEEDDAEPATAQLIRQIEAGRTTPLVAEPASEDGSADSAGSLTVELVGRESQFAQLLQAFEGARRGPAQHVHITAPAGLGKTRLLGGLSARLRAARTRVVEVRAVPAERSLPFAFAGQLVTALVPLRGAKAVSPDAARTLVALAPAASTYYEVEPDRSSGDDAVRRRSLAVTELVTAVAADTPLALLVDDVHWMDAASRTVLASLATRAGDARLLLVTAARPNDRFLESVPSARVVTLAPLSIDDIGALVMSVARLPAEPWAEEFPAWLHASTGGSPLLVLEALQLAIERDVLTLAEGSWQAPDPSALAALLSAGRAMQQRIAALPPAAREALLRLACAGAPIADDELPRLLPADAREALALLETRGLVVRDDDQWRPAHDEIAALAVDLAADADRVRAHQAMAELLEQAGEADLPRLLRAAWHRARAADLAGLDRTFAAAVRRARVSGEQAAIAELGREALGADVPDADLSRLIARLPRHLRRRRQLWAPTVAVLASLTVAMAALAWRVSRPATAGDLGLDVLIGAEDGGVAWVHADLQTELLDNGQPVDASRMASPVPLVPDSLQTGVSAQLADGSVVVGFTRTGRDSLLAMELVRFARGRSPEPVLSGPYDQAMPVASPDGRWIAFANRGRDTVRQTTELELWQPGMDTAIRLTRTPYSDLYAAWSHDGSRIAYMHVAPDSLTPAAVCWMSSRGGRPTCHPVSRAERVTAVHAWDGDWSALVSIVRFGSFRTVLSRVDLRDGRIVPLDSSATGYAADPHGEAVLCTCDVPGYADPVVAVFRADRPERKRVLLLDGRPVRASDLSRTMWSSRRPHLASAAIVGPSTVAAGEEVVYRLQGRGATGSALPTPWAEWEVSDTTIATVATDGTLRARRTGAVRLTARLGIVRDASLDIAVRPAAFAVRLRESWASGTGTWIDFGDPQPRVSRTSDRATLQLNGDQRLTSGVFSEATFPAAAGLGVSVRFRAPLTQPLWQTLFVSLSAAPSDAELASWDDRAGGRFPTEWTVETASCILYVPRGEGYDVMRWPGLSASGVNVPIAAPVPFGDGRWHEATLQLLPDGRCAGAIDGTVLGVSGRAIPLDRPMRLQIHGQSVGTTVEVGEVELWTGVRPSVRWTVARDSS